MVSFSYIYYWINKGKPFTSFTPNWLVNWNSLCISSIYLKQQWNGIAVLCFSHLTFFFFFFYWQKEDILMSCVTYHILGTKLNCHLLKNAKIQWTMYQTQITREHDIFWSALRLLFMNTVWLHVLQRRTLGAARYMLPCSVQLCAQWSCFLLNGT